MNDRKQAISTYLAESRAALNEVLDQLSDEQWQTPIQDGDEHWTPRHILAHIYDAERGMIGQVTRIAAGETPIPPDFDLDRWNRRAVQKLETQSVAELRAKLFETRTLLGQTIEALSDDSLDMVGRHSSLQMLSVEAILRLIGEHELGHAVVIAAAFALPVPQ